MNKSQSQEDIHNILSPKISQLTSKFSTWPTTLTSILILLQNQDLYELQKIDPCNKILIQMIIGQNQKAIYDQFHKIGQFLLKIVIQNIQKYQIEHSINFLADQLSQQINKITNSNQFKLKLQKYPQKIGTTLWQKLYDQLIDICMSITGFLHKYYQIPLNKINQSIQIQKYIENFLIKFKQRQKLNKLYILYQKLDDEIIKIKQQSILIQKIQSIDDQYINQINQFDQKSSIIYSQQKSIQQDRLLAIKYQQQENRLSNENNNKKGFLNNIKDKLSSTFQNIKATITKNSPYQQKSINQIQLQQNVIQLLQNLQHVGYLNTTQQNIIHQYYSMNINQLQFEINYKLDYKQIGIIKYAIQQPIKKWQNHHSSIAQQSDRSINYTIIMINYSEQLLQATNKIKSANTQQTNALILLSIYFYKILSKQYTPFTKKYLFKILKIIQKQFTRKQIPYLRGIQQILQIKQIKPTKFANLIHNQKPLRSQSFQQSNESIIYIKNNYFQNPQKIKKQTDLLLNQIRHQNMFKQNTPTLEIIRINKSPQSKIITISISGFLSEDSQKDLQWMGLIRSIQNTQLYSITWQSSTLKDAATYLGKKILQFALNPINLTGVGILTNAINIGAKIAKQYQNNPFANAHARAKLVGIYLAQIIMKVFPDRFINLIGFSLGTEVLHSCLQRIASKGRLQMIHKIVTLGGAACKQGYKNTLAAMPVSIEYYNFWSKNDFAIRYIYQLIRLGSTAVGSCDFPILSGHEILNINATKFVKSHMDFRANLYSIGLLTGMAYD